LIVCLYWFRKERTICWLFHFIFAAEILLWQNVKYDWYRSIIWLLLMYVCFKCNYWLEKFKMWAKFINYTHPFNIWDKFSSSHGCRTVPNSMSDNCHPPSRQKVIIRCIWVKIFSNDFSIYPWLVTFHIVFPKIQQSTQCTDTKCNDAVIDNLVNNGIEETEYTVQVHISLSVWKKLFVIHIMSIYQKSI
jgi:hypothetical protein